MEDQSKQNLTEDQLSDEQLSEVAGGKNVQQRRLEHLDSQTKSVDDIQKTRLEGLDERDSSK
ncbi:MAG: hypothetical protein AAGJ95_12180 [Cyanobacteria bacterium J06554_11]